MQQLTELMPAKEAEIESVGGFNAALTTLVKNEQAMAHIRRSFNPSLNTDQYVNLFNTEDSRFNFDISTDQARPQRVRLTETSGTNRHEQYFELKPLNGLGTITSNERKTLLTKLGEQPEGETLVFAPLNATADSINGFGDRLALTLEETILSRPRLVEQMTPDKVVAGYRTSMSALPAIGRRLVETPHT